MAYAGAETRRERLCTLRTHESSYSQEDVLFNLDRFPGLSVWDGDLAQIVPVKTGIAAKDFVKQNRDGEEVDTFSTRMIIDGEGSSTAANGITAEVWRAYTFVVRDAPKEVKEKDSNMRISISSTIAALFGYKSGMQVVVRIAEREQCVASHVELTFRDEYLSRGDMWRLATSELSERTVYKDQKILFLNTIKATVKNVWINGKSRMSGYFASDTKPVFRSESARYTLFIQMSREMWEFDTESAGEIMFNKVIHGFLPELFKKWMSINAHHLVSIILFARLEYDEKSDSQLSDGVRSSVNGSSPDYQDFYRVVVSDMASNDWINILDQLKREFLTFLQEICLQKTYKEEEGKSVIVGTPSQAYKGNLLEAINLAGSQFSRDYIDRDLVRTGISIIVITAGSGYYEVNYDMLKLTTDVLMGSGIGIDLVCLSPMPLHSVPLFAYRNPRVLGSTVPTQTPSPAQSIGDHTPRQSEQYFRKLATNGFSKSIAEPRAGEWSYAIPHWVDVSYWRGEANEAAMQLKKRKSVPPRGLKKPEEVAYQPRIRLYDLQMGGLMENEMTSIAVPKLHESPLHPWHRWRRSLTGKAVTKEVEAQVGEMEREWMEDYDDYIFRPQHEKKSIESAARKRAQKTLNDSSRLTKEAGKQDLDYREELVGPQVGSYRPSGTGYLEWKMKEKHDDSASVGARRKQSVASLASTATTQTSAMRTPSRKLLRQISFGSGSTTYKPSEPSVSADLISAAVVKPATFTKRKDEKSPSKPAPVVSTFTQQFRAALSRSTSQASTPNTPALTAVPEDSKESSRPIEIGAGAVAKLRVQHGRQSSDEILASSLDTLRGSNRGGAKRDLAKEQIAEDKLGGMAHLRRNIPYLSSSADAAPIPTTVTLTRALSPWLDLLNPCNPRKEDSNAKSQFSRWQHVFPKARRTDTVKWKSLCYPASVPLTNDNFPTADQLASEYHENFYHLIQDTDQDVAESREHLVRELIAFRLAHGFQLIVGDSVSEFLGNKRSDLARVFDKSYMAQDGATIFMSVGNTIHQLLCGAEGKTEIRRFRRKPTEDYEPFEGSNAVSYRPMIKTYLARAYEPRDVTFKNSSNEYNWNLIDNFIAGYSEDFSDALRFWRARFVLIPVDIPVRSHALSTVREDTDEEIRLEGIKRLTQLWQRNRVLPDEERLVRSLNKRKDPNPLAIEYQTRDPSAVIAAGIDSLLINEAEVDPSTAVETHTTKSYDIKALAEELQGDNGIRMMDRRWHWRLHYNCFVGSDMANWLLLTFKDIETREGAVEFGNRLMQEGLFVHVKGEKDFRDGQYFYQLANDYRSSRPESRMGWFTTGRASMKSVPATPMVDHYRGLPQFDGASESKASTIESSEDEEVEKIAGRSENRKVYLSKVMKYDVDPRHKSYRPEIINLHYDRLHNPDNCYHIRIDWMNVTSKFIEDAIVYWAGTVERYGLRLVEVPIGEACTITDEHPFRSPYIINLAKQPPSVFVSRFYESTTFAAMKKPDPQMYHKALLRRMNFVLDVESAASFPSDVDVQYSWGKPNFKYTQYIHKSGVLLAQITDDGNILLVANRLYSDRGSARREGSRINQLERELDRRAQASSRRSPMASPAMRAALEGTKFVDLLPGERGKQITAEEIKDELEAFFHDEYALQAFYEDFNKQIAASASPQVQPTIPDLSLPPKVRPMVG